MSDFSLVPVDHQPDFEDVSLVPVDHDPFGADGVTRQAQLGQAKPAQAQQMPAEPQPVVTPTPVQSRDESKDDCIRRCSDLALPTPDYGIQFQRCMLACMSGGNSGFPRWDRYF
ncbi:hypothetical protein [Bradyrhizobium sp.]|uniref:hypothetical protein n=1 Tax=Bradyrhizobium sp. TaxID=376 RepID=UPI002625140B|nr:hypothetical protein [Bradyrhizobium sp.]